MLSIEGKIVSNNTFLHRRIEINESTGLIVSVCEPTGTANIVLKDELIFPGFTDLHVHSREDVGHTQDYKEDFISAGDAAINGGVVAFADMPNNKVPPIDEQSFSLKNRLAQKSSVPIILYAGIGPTTKPLNKKVPYKVFMGPSVGDLFFTSLEELEKVIEKYRGEYISFHCEEPEILKKNSRALTHEASRPPEAEISAVDFAIRLIKKFDLIGKICHCSTVEGIEKIMKAKSDGVRVTVEVTPHHLYFDETMLGAKRKQFQVNPPIRQTRENRLALISLLRNGDIDYLATDHAPHTIEEKEKGTSGLTHLDTYAPFTTWLMKEHNFTPEDIYRICSKNPSSFLNHFSNLQYGKIENGFVGSLTILNINKPITITKEKLKTKCGWSPFEGVTFPGSVHMTIVGGKVYTIQ